MLQTAHSYFKRVLQRKKKTEGIIICFYFVRILTATTVTPTALSQPLPLIPRSPALVHKPPFLPSLFLPPSFSFPLFFLFFLFLLFSSFFLPLPCLFLSSFLSCPVYMVDDLISHVRYRRQCPLHPSPSSGSYNPSTPVPRFLLGTKGMTQMSCLRPRTQ